MQTCPRGSLLDCCEGRLKEKPKPKVFADDTIQCAWCGSIRVIKFGTKAKNKWLDLLTNALTTPSEAGVQTTPRTKQNQAKIHIG
jgi:hypothetical protein